MQWMDDIDGRLMDNMHINGATLIVRAPLVHLVSYQDIQPAPRGGGVDLTGEDIS